MSSFLSADSKRGEPQEPESRPYSFGHKLPLPADLAECARRRESSGRHGSLLALVSFLVLLLGCAGPSTSTLDADGATALPSVSAAPPVLTSDGLEMVESTKRTRLWVKPDHHIGRYDNVLISGIGFAYQKGQERLSPEQEEELGDMLSKSIGEITAGSSAVGQAEEPGPCVVSVQVGLRDVVLHISENTSGSSISFVSSFGSATMIVEFRDSTTDVPLVRYAANRGLGGGPGTGQMGANMNRLGRTLGTMVKDMTNELQTIVPTTTVRAQTECNDGIYKMTGRG